MPASDSLILYICEHDVDLDDTDTTVYVFYDHEEGLYYIRGNRVSLKKGQAIVRGKPTAPYSFACRRVADVAAFLETVLDDTNHFSVELISLTDLPVNSDDITYKLLSKKRKHVAEVVAYDRVPYDKLNLYNYLSLVRTMFNEYYANEEEEATA
jgi:hypothetical protein